MKLLSALLVVSMPVSGFADVVVPVDKVEVSVNIRLMPDAASEIVGRLNQGESAALVSSEADWHEIALEGGSTGYISADWSRVVGEEQYAEELLLRERQSEVATGKDSLPEASAAAAATELPVEEVVEVTTEVPEPVAEPLPEPESRPEPPAAPPGSQSSIEGTENFLVKFHDSLEGGNSQVFDDGNRVGIGTTEPKQRLEVNGSIQIHEQNSSVAGLMITQSSGDTGYIMHNRASTLTIGAGSMDRITIDRDGNVGFAVSRPGHPLEMASGAHVTAGGAWTNSSSRLQKENVTTLAADQATATVMALQPVSFNYKNEAGEDYVGFIAEDVPDLVAMNQRDSLSTMDIVAVLTRVVQEQQKRIDELEARIKGSE